MKLSDAVRCQVINISQNGYSIEEVDSLRAEICCYIDNGLLNESTSSQRIPELIKYIESKKFTIVDYGYNKTSVNLFIDWIIRELMKECYDKTLKTAKSNQKEDRQHSKNERKIIRPSSKSISSKSLIISISLIFLFIFAVFVGIAEDSNKKNSYKPSQTNKYIKNETNTSRQKENSIPVRSTARSSTDNKTVSDSATISISVNAKCKAYNHVGNEWSKKIYIDGKKINSSSTLKVKIGDSFTIDGEIIEEDSNPDIGRFSQTINVTSETITKGETITQTVLVRENSGRYAGNTAEWKITITLKPK